MVLFYLFYAELVESSFTALDPSFTVLELETRLTGSWKMGGMRVNQNLINSNIFHGRVNLLF